MFNEMGKSVLMFRFITRTGIDENSAMGYRTFNTMVNQSDSVWQR
jgi:hypothetical protein